MKESELADAANNIENGDRDAVDVAVHNEAKVQILIPMLCLPVRMTYLGENPATTA